MFLGLHLYISAHFKSPYILSVKQRYVKQVLPKTNLGISASLPPTSENVGYSPAACVSCTMCNVTEPLQNVADCYGTLREPHWTFTECYGTVTGTENIGLRLSVASHCQISSKSVKRLQRYCDFSSFFFQDSGSPPSWICFPRYWTTQDVYLMVSTATQNLVGIHAAQFPWYERLNILRG